MSSMSQLFQIDIFMYSTGKVGMTFMYAWYGVVSTMPELQETAFTNPLIGYRCYHTAKEHLVRSETFTPYQGCEPRYFVSQTGLCNKVCTGMGDGQFALPHTQVKLKVLPW